jgi:uncharacterized membrane protein YcaP (DUF421 family)
MNFNLIWQTILIFIVATFLLRIGGRKTISQMTVPQTVIMIGIGTLLIQPVTGKGLWTTFVVAGILVLSLIITEYIQLKMDGAETFISGKAIPVIENGDIIENNLRKLRLPVDKLEERLRQFGITKISDVQYATLESNGQLGYTLINEKQPATKEDIQNLIELLKNGQLINPSSQTSNQNNIFTETLNNKNSTDVPKYLQ